MIANDAARATAEGLPNINRRRMLLGLAAASTAAATGAVANAVETPALPTENPKLIALIEELPGIATAYHVAADAYRAMTKKWKAATPLAPDELTVPGTDWPHGDPRQPGDTEAEALGGYLLRSGEDYPRRIIIRAWQLDRKIWDARRAKRSAKKNEAVADFLAAEAEIKRLKKLLAVADDYEARFAEVKAQAHAAHEEAYPIMSGRKDALERHVAAIMNEPDHTMEGLVIKAQALAEWDRVGDRYFDRVAYQYGQDWHGQIAASILRYAKGGAS